MKSKSILLIIVALLTLLTACSDDEEDAESAEDFPDKSIKVVVGYGAGGSNDAIARIIIEGANKYLPNDQTFTVENVEGGAGSIGLSQLSNSKADGYTIGFTPTGPLTIVPNTEDVDYTVDSFDYIMKAASIPQMLHVSADSDLDDFDDWKKYVEKNPGKFTYATSGNESEQRVAMERLNSELGIETKDVAYDSGATSAGALTNGEVDGVVVFPGMVDEKDGKPLFSYSGESEGYEDIPTLKEEDVDISQDVYSGFVAPEDIPDDKMEIIHSALKQSLEDPEVKEELEDKLGYPVTYENSEDYEQDIVDQAKENKSILDEINN